MAGAAWLYLGVGANSPGETQQPVYAGVLTSSYRLPPVVVDIALDIEGRGVYAAESRRPGLNRQPVPKDIPRDYFYKAGYAVDPDAGGIHRYTYVAPEFVLGASLFEKRRHEQWAAISDQNRWQGLILRGSPESRIYLYPEGVDAARSYNTFWAVQHKGTQMTQALPPPYSRGYQELRVWFGTGSERIEKDGWVFVSNPAYVAVRPAFGGYRWDPDEPRSMKYLDQKSPVIIDVARPNEFESFAAFQKAVIANPVVVRNGVLEYRGIATGARFRFSIDSDRLPEVNGAPVVINPPYLYAGGFLSSAWGSGTVLVKKGKRQLKIEFR